MTKKAATAGQLNLFYSTSKHLAEEIRRLLGERFPDDESLISWS